MIVTTQTDAVTTIRLHRPQQHNALNAALIQELTAALQSIHNNSQTRVVLLTATGDTFCAGADLHWMKTNHSRADNIADAKQLSQLLHTLYTLNKPCIALVQGPAYGGGIGLIACCDIALATEQVKFCFAEVKLGLIPAMISPYVINAIGAHQARRYFITAESFTADQAQQMGLIHNVTDSLVADGQQLAQRIIKNGPQAVSQTKQLIQQIPQNKSAEQLAEWLADIKASAEAQEGIQAFFAKRKPDWSN